MNRLTYLILIFFISACSTNQVTITITNDSEITVSKIETINLSGLDFNNLTIYSHLLVKDNQGKSFPYQLIDNNKDNNADQLLIQVSLPPKSSTQLHLSITEQPRSKLHTTRTYCRFVPERMDDFAWENDKVAFRVYGPACQKLFESGKPGGLISSGIDCWLKRVEYPIIDKWYKKEQEGGSYHQDNGEGLDNFHVGTSRGCGGTAIRYKGSFIYSENFSEWEILENGPLRSVFRLKYKPVMVEGIPVTETKTFSIGLGDQFYRCDVEFESALTLDTLAIGLTLHGNLGKTDSSTEGWISYWEPMEDSEIGMGAWVDQKYFLGSDIVISKERDNNHIWILSALHKNKCTYYSGFTWKKSGNINTEETWKEYIQKELVSLKNPLSISVD